MVKFVERSSKGYLEVETHHEGDQERSATASETADPTSLIRREDDFNSKPNDYLVSSHVLKEYSLIIVDVDRCTSGQQKA
jgi:protein required for attachment to host cells